MKNNLKYQQLSENYFSTSHDGAVTTDDKTMNWRTREICVCGCNWVQLNILSSLTSSIRKQKSYRIEQKPFIFQAQKAQNLWV